MTIAVAFFIIACAVVSGTIMVALVPFTDRRGRWIRLYPVIALDVALFIYAYWRLLIMVAAS